VSTISDASVIIDGINGLRLIQQEEDMTMSGPIRRQTMAMLPIAVLHADGR